MRKKGIKIVSSRIFSTRTLSRIHSVSDRSFDFRSIFRVGLLLSVAWFWNHAEAQNASQILPNTHGFEMSLWAREPMLKNPVALSFDDQGRLFVVETARRGTVDIDIRSHRDWAYEDLANQSISQLRLFFRRNMAPELSEKNSGWLVDRNQDGSHDWRDLMTVKERIHRIEDTDGDGVADKSTLFYEGFNEEFNGVIAGVMPYQDDVWATVYPDVWRFQDSDDDGRADSTKQWFRGFGVHAAYDGHDIHGLTLGPEGKIYFSVGDNGFSLVTLEGERLHYPNTGGVLRMNPDGSQLEVYAYGLRNVQEIAFDEYGNLFSVDNDGDIEDERERFVYIAEGSDSGWRLNWQFRTRGWTRYMNQPDYNPWIHEKMWIPYFPEQPAHITPPLSNYSVGPGGFKYNPGAALNDEYQGYFFLAQFPVQKITAFQTRRQGAGFEMVNEHVFQFGLMASAMNFGPDGAMYIADWDGSWQPNERGAIHRLDDPNQSNSPIRRQVRLLLKEGMSHRSSEELVQLLGHPDQRIRHRSQTALAMRGEGSRLLATAKDMEQPQLARIHALWGLIEMRADGLSGLGNQLPFLDADPEIRAQTAKVAGDLKLDVTVPSLRKLLKETQEPRVQAYAAMALGKIRNRDAESDLVTLLQKDDGKDPFLRHAGVMALVGCGTEASLSALAKSQSTAVRIAAVVALRRLKSPAVTAFLKDSEVRVIREAVRAIHDDFSIISALSDLAGLDLSEELLEDEAIFRRVLNVNLRLGGRSNASRLLGWALNDSAPFPVRQEALACLSVWNQRPYLDRVEGRARHLGSRDEDLGRQLIEANVMALLDSGDDELTKMVTQYIRREQIAVSSDVLLRWLRDSSQPLEVRLDALQALFNRESSQLIQGIEIAIESEISDLRIAGFKLEALIRPESTIGRVQRLRDLPVSEGQALIRLLGETRTTEAVSLLSEYLEQLKEGDLAGEFALETIRSAQTHGSADLIPAIREIIQSDNDLYQYSLMGGNIEAGREVYETHLVAQCVRCHNAGGKGKQVGPELKGIGARVDQNYLLESLLNPSAQIANGFQIAVVETSNGEILSGVIAKEDEAKIVLALVSGGETEIEKSDIQNREMSAVSAMPSMSEILSPEEVRDLIAYLKTL